MRAQFHWRVVYVLYMYRYICMCICARSLCDSRAVCCACRVCIIYVGIYMYVHMRAQFVARVVYVLYIRRYICMCICARCLFHSRAVCCACRVCIIYVRICMCRCTRSLLRVSCMHYIRIGIYVCAYARSACFTRVLFVSRVVYVLYT